MHPLSAPTAHYCDGSQLLSLSRCFETVTLLIAAVAAVYAVWPTSVLFLITFTFATQRFSRAALFNIVLCSFMAFYGGFALLYPYHEHFHLTTFADATLKQVPAGMTRAAWLALHRSDSLSIQIMCQGVLHRSRQYL